jgi:hypothetical protein
MQYLRLMIREGFNQLLRLAVPVSLLLCCPISSHATIYVIVIGRRQIAIASDSRRATMVGSRITTADGIEKVVPLGSRIAFMSAGLSEISTNSTTIMPDRVAKECYLSLTKNRGRVSIGHLSDAFGQTITERMNRLSASGKAQIDTMLQQFGSQGNQAMESIFVGVDDDGQLRIETVNVYLHPPSSATESAGFEWTRHETSGNDPNIILSGDVGVLRSAFENDASPIAQLSSFKTWWQAFREGKTVDSGQTAEGLVSLAIKYSPPERIGLGYPIFVYAVNVQNGFRKLRSVPRGKASLLPH